MRIADGLEVLEIKSNIMGKPDIIYPTLIFDKDTVVLVDAGYPGQVSDFCEAIEKTGVPFDKLDKVILTHQDIDHIGSLLSIQKEINDKVEVLAHEEEKAYIQGDKCPIKLAQLAAKLDSLPEAMKDLYYKLKSGFENCKVKVDEVLADGQELPYCGGITVIHTPGHTPGHICLYLSQSKTLIAGDALGIENGLLVKPPSHICFDAALNIESLKKLTKYDIETIICYHGGVYKGNVPQRVTELISD